MDNTSIVIPVTDIRSDKNKEQLTRLLDSLRESDNEHNCIVCFDSCDSEFVRFFIQKYKKILPLVNDKNRLQFAKNANRGLRYAHNQFGNSALLVNQDCTLPKSLGLWSKEDAIICGSVTNEPDFCALERLNQDSQGELTELNKKFAFNCVYIDKKVMDKIGYLDGSFICTFEDDDYISRARLAGFKCFQSDIKFYHEGDFIDSSQENWESASGSYTSYNLQINLMKYATKYQIPNGIEHENMLQWILDHHTWKDEMRVA